MNDGPNRTDSSSSGHQSGERERHPETLCMLACLSAFTAAGVVGAILYRWSPIGVTSLAWVAAQSLTLTTTVFVFAALIARRWPRTAVAAGALTLLALFAIVVCDVVAFAWIGERFLSRATWRVMTELREPLAGHVNPPLIKASLVVASVCGLYCVVSWWAACRIANSAVKSIFSRPKVTGATVLLILFTLSLPALSRGRAGVESMAKHSQRHPFCIFRLVDGQGVGAALKEHPAESDTDSKVADSLETRVLARVDAQRRLAVDPSFDNQASDLPDVLIVVIESFRHELVDPQTMPHLWELASRGVHCRQHYSGGNATNHGMFSLFNGLEAIWYEREVRFTPLMNRIFRQAGYELGFFGGHDDWRKFMMDGYVNDDQFDVFETAAPNWLASDRDATRRAADFLDADRGTRKPRLCVLYLYSTHANYHSYLSDRVFHPAADDRFLIPYRMEDRPRVWNRYRNSARSIDRFLPAVLHPDRVTVVTGDHGESFLEDGVCGHGVRVSRTQNMTPAVIFFPDVTPRRIDEPTMHADLLPTLLGAVAIPLTDDDVFDGVDLAKQDGVNKQDGANQDDGGLSGRLFLTRNYLQEDVGIIGEWSRHDRPFAFRAQVSLRSFTARALNAIDATGNEAEWDNGETESRLKRWISLRFGP